MGERDEKLVVLSRCVFPATGATAFDGFVATEGNRIVAVGPRDGTERYIRDATRVVDAGDRTVIPGMTDDHTFFTGWVLLSLRVDLSGVRSPAEGVEALRAGVSEGGPDSPMFGHAVPERLVSPEGEAVLDEAFPDRPVVAFTADRGTCWMNGAARERYGFTPQECHAEATWRLMRDYLRLPQMHELYRACMRMLNRRGITQIKEMSFDDYYGFVDVMERMEENDELTVRVSLMSQPVGRGMDLDMRAHAGQLRGAFLEAAGFNRMTDRSIASGMAELKSPYLSTPGSTCSAPVEWDLIERELGEADREGFRYSLHCQGDGAVGHVVDLYERCRRDGRGRLVNRHAIADMELSDPRDIDRFGKMGGICEVYPQIQSLDRESDLLAMVDRQVGRERFGRYWMRRRMWDSGCVVCCGTDLPLMLPSIGESLWCGVGGHFADGGSANLQNMLTASEMLRAWTANGAYDCYDEDRLGTLEPGKLADIVVLEANVLEGKPQDLRDVNAALTVSDGRVVYDCL